MKRRDELYVDRCFDLAIKGKGNASPNPLVGSVIVYEDRIIGEGYHQQYGGPHAEVNAVASVATEDLPLLAQSTIYINLEPCCIYGNTPPCTNLIIKHKIPRVVFSCLDQTAGVQGKSIKILEAAGCEVIVGIQRERGESLNQERSIFTTQQRPYVILKYAQSSDGFLGKTEQSVWLSNSISKRLVHKWRSESDAIMVGTNTAQTDNPKLTNRLFYGKSPLRIVLDRELRLAPELHLFDQSQPTWVITEQKNAPNKENLSYKQFQFNDQLLSSILYALFQEKHSTLIVEGGKQLLHSFIDAGLWDEARVFETPALLHEGLKAPMLQLAPAQSFKIKQDHLKIFYRS